MGVVESIVKLLSHEDIDVVRQSAAALSSLCLNGNHFPQDNELLF